MFGTCAPFDFEDDLSIDGETCILGRNAIPLEKHTDSNCETNLSFTATTKMHSSNDEPVYIHFSRDGGRTYYTDNEGDGPRIATRVKDDSEIYSRRKLCGSGSGCICNGKACGTDNPWPYSDSGCFKDTRMCCSNVSAFIMNCWGSG